MYDILNLWPIPIYKKNIGMKSDWKDIIHSYEWKQMKSGSGQLTKTLSLLNDERLAELKNLVLNAAHEYTKHYLKIENRFKIISSNSSKFLGFKEKSYFECGFSPVFITGILL